MYRALVAFAALVCFPAAAAAQQPCTTDARHVVNEVYRHVLERQADPSSEQWVQQLESRRMTVRDVVRAIVTSAEHTERFVYTEAGESTPYERSVARLYRHVLGREPDAQGLHDLTRLAQEHGPQAVIDFMLASAEYNQQFGAWGLPGSGGIRFCPPSLAVSGGVTQGETRIARRFRGMDRNGDGMITRREWRGSRRAFERHDRNDDSVLSGAELDPDSARLASRIATEQFDRMDRNNDLRISLSEWNGSVATFNQLDVDNDGTLSLAEFPALTTDEAIGTSGSAFLVDPRERWTDTGIDVIAGDGIDFDVNGTIQMSSNPNDIADPNGARSGRRASNAPLGGSAAGALIARIGDGPPFFVGNRRSVRATTGGRVFLGVNDDRLTDNSGHFHVVLGVR